MQMYKGHKDSSKPWETFYPRNLPRRLPCNYPLYFCQIGEAVRFFLVEGVHVCMYIFIYNIDIPYTQMTSIFEGQQT